MISKEGHESIPLYRRLFVAHSSRQDLETAVFNAHGFGQKSLIDEANHNSFALFMRFPMIFAARMHIGID